MTGEMNRANRAALYLALMSVFFAVLACTSTLSRLDDPDILKRDDLSGYDFAYVQLSGVDLSNKNLRGVDFDGADLTGADFTNATLDERWVPIIDLLTTFEGAGQDFRGVDLSETYLPTADLSGADLRGANLSRAHLGGADLSDADLAGADLRGTNLAGAILRNADLTGTRLNGRTNLLRTSLVEVTITSEQVRSAGSGLSCTRLPDGTIVDEARCRGTPPPP